MILLKIIVGSSTPEERELNTQPIVINGHHYQIKSITNGWGTDGTVRAYDLEEIVSSEDDWKLTRPNWKYERD